MRARAYIILLYNKVRTVHVRAINQSSGQSVCDFTRNNVYGTYTTAAVVSRPQKTRRPLHRHRRKIQREYINIIYVSARACVSPVHPSTRRVPESRRLFDYASRVFRRPPATLQVHRPWILFLYPRPPDSPPPCRRRDRRQEFVYTIYNMVYIYIYSSLLDQTINSNDGRTCLVPRPDSTSTIDTTYNIAII